MDGNGQRWTQNRTAPRESVAHVGARYRVPVRIRGRRTQFNIRSELGLVSRRFPKPHRISFELPEIIAASSQFPATWSPLVG
jgi:hypothetical protein